MQIKKINNDKLKVILNSHDLYEKNIDIDAFLSNPIEAQNLFFEILDEAEEKYNFEIQNNKAIVEAISLDNNIFMLTITRLNNESCTYFCTPKTFCFENINDLINFYCFAKKNNIKIETSNIYEFNNKFYFILNEENQILENYLSEFSCQVINSNFLQNFFAEYGHICKKNSL